jgi:hypothetical protein
MGLAFFSHTFNSIFNHCQTNISQQKRSQIQMNEILTAIPWMVISPILALDLVLILAALYSLVKAEHTNGPKWIWAIIILIFNLFGPVAFFVFGRRSN